MCEQLDWMRELENLKWAVASLVDLHSRGSYQREITENATQGIKARIDWILKQAEAETKRNKR